MSPANNSLLEFPKEVEKQEETLSENRALQGALSRIDGSSKFSSGTPNIVSYDDFQYDDCGHDDTVYDR